MWSAAPMFADSPLQRCDPLSWQMQPKSAHQGFSRVEPWLPSLPLPTRKTVALGIMPAALSHENPASPPWLRSVVRRLDWPGQTSDRQSSEKNLKVAFLVARLRTVCVV